MAIINGTAGDDNLIGTPTGDDFHIEQGGTDVAQGKAGIDVFYVGGGFDASDRIDGGLDADYVVFAGDYSSGLTFTETTVFNVENFTLSAGFDYNFSGLADANIEGSLAIDADELTTCDTFILDASNVLHDTLTVHGGAGGDTVTTGGGDDVLFGGDGDDLLTGGLGGDDLTGDSGDDVLTGNTGDDYLKGMDGDDVLGGGEGDDSLQGSDGFDVLNGRTGDDWLNSGEICSGGDGDDFIFYTSEVGSTLDGGTDRDTLFISFTDENIVLSGSQLIDFELIEVAHCDGVITVQDDLLAAGQGISVKSNKDSTAAIKFDGSGETDGWFKMTGSFSGDVLTGGSGDDNIEGSSGSDIITGLKGDDSLFGGTGDDRLLGGAGDDFIYTYSTSAALGDFVDGGKGNDVMTSTGGGAVLNGGLGNDQITGGLVNDTLTGGKGSDVLNGGGGGGVDRYVYKDILDSRVDAADQITALNMGSTIDLAQIDADSTTIGDQAFHLVDALSGAAAELALIYDSFRNTTNLVGDVDGDRSADFLITINGDQTAYTNFVL